MLNSVKVEELKIILRLRGLKVNKGSSVSISEVINWEKGSVAWKGLFLKTFPQSTC